MPECPSQDRLQVFVEGKLAEAEMRQVMDHVDMCDDCQTVVGTIADDADTIVASLRMKSAPDRHEQEPECEKAVALVQAVGKEASIGTRTAAANNDAPDLGQIGPYRFLEKLGEGGMGAVYKALHTRLRRVVAVKVLPVDRTKDAEAIARFDREMEAVGQLDHPNIVRASDADEENGVHYLVMEYVRGADLSGLVRIHGQIPVAEACDLVRQAAVGLQHAHEHGMVHRDIKPSNLMLTPKGQVKILDMGLALLDDPSTDEQQRDLTSTGQLMGTVDYMAPEQGMDTHNVDIRADIYALGATLYKLLTGRAPLDDPKYDTIVKKMVALATEQSPSIAAKRPDLHPGLIAVIDSMLAKDKDARPATPADVAAALAPFCAGARPAALFGEDAETPASWSQLDAATASPAGAFIETDRTFDVDPTASGAVVQLIDATAIVDSSMVTARTPAVPVAAARGGSRNNRNLLIAACGGMGLLLLAGIVFIVQLGKITVQITIADPAMTVRVDDDKIHFEGATTKPIKLWAGDHTMIVEQDGVIFEATKFTIQKKKRNVLHVAIVDGKVELSKDGAPPAIAAKRSKPANGSADHGSEEKRGRRIDYTKYTQRNVLGQHEGWSTAVAWSPDGSHIASVGNDCRIWDATTGAKEAEMPDCVIDVAFSSDGKRLATVNKDMTTVEIRDAGTREIQGSVSVAKDGQRVWPAAKSSACAVTFSPDDRFLATATGNFVYVWNVETRREHFKRRGVAPIKFSPDGTLLLTNGHGHDFPQILDVETGDVRAVLNGGRKPIDWSADGKLIATATDDGTISFWDGKTFGEKGKLSVSGGNLAAAVLSPDSETLVTAHFREGVFFLRFWDIASGQQIVEIKGKAGKFANDPTFSPDGRTLAYASESGRVGFLDFEATDQPVTPLPTADAEQIDLKRGLVGHWSFEEPSGSVARDASGNENHGEIKGNPNRSDDVPPNALAGKSSLAISKTEQFVEIAAAAELRPTREVTVSVWRKLNSFQGVVDLLRIGGGNSFRMIAGGGFYLTIDGTTAGSVTGGTPLLVADRKWHHIVGRFDGTALTTYCDGVRIRRVPATGQIQAVDQPLYLASLKGEETADFLVDDVRIYSRVLSEAEIAVLAGKARLPESMTPLPVADAGQVDLKRGLVGHWNFEEGKGTQLGDSSGNGNHGTLKATDLSAVWTNDAPPVSIAGQKCITLTSSDQLAQIPSSPSLDMNDAITISAWAKSQPENAIEDIAERANNVGWRLLFDVRLVIAKEAGGFVMIPTAVRSKRGEWYHVVGSYDGAKLRTYLNGDLVRELDHTGTIQNRSVPIRFGKYINDKLPRHVSIDDVRIYNRALSSDEIAVLAGKARLPESVVPLPVADAGQVDLKRGLVGHWNFEEGEGDRVGDSSGNGNDGTIEAAASDFNWTDDVPPVPFAGRSSLTMQGKGKAVTIPVKSGWNITTQMTIAGWARSGSQSPSLERSLLSKGGNENIRMTVGGRFLFHTSSTNPADILHGPPVPRPTDRMTSGQWYHLVARYDGQTMAVYLDGQRVVQAQHSDPVIETDNNLEIGGLGGSAPGTPTSIDDVRLYNRALTEAEIAVLAGKAELPESVAPLPAAEAEQVDEWRPVFDGKSLDGWEQFGGDTGDWKVVDGILTSGGQRNRLVYTRESFDDFDVRVECRLDNLANSGLYLRTDKSETPSVGYEAQLAFASTRGHAGCYVGGIYKYALFKESLVGPGEWFTLEARCRGSMISLFVNGKETVNYDDPDKRFDSGYIALSIWNGGVAEFRKVEVRTPIGDAKGETVAGSPDLSSGERKDSDRRAAEWVLSVGGTVKVISESNEEQMFKPGGTLPDAKFRVKIIDLANQQTVDDDALARLAGLIELYAIRLSGASVSDAGLKHLSGLEKLSVVTLDGTKVTAAGVAALKKTLPDCRVIAD